MAGSVRVPAHFSGIYSLRCSTGRWPKMGMNTSMPGQEGVPAVFSPMARTLDDLVYFSRSLIGIKPWLWDHTVHPIEWRTDEERKVKETKKFKIGVMRTDGKTNPIQIYPAINILLSRFKELSTHHQLVPVHSNAPYPLSRLKVIPRSTYPPPPHPPLFSLPPSSSSPTVATPFSLIFEPAKQTTPVLVNYRCT